jgi:putative ABC transport system permease protein
VRLAAHLVPADDRAAWIEEWHAELGWAWGHRPPDRPPWAHRIVLAGRAPGAVPDALAYRRVHGGPAMRSPDLRLAARALLRRPGYTALVALTLALGIGATTAVFTVVDAVLLRPLPFRDVDRLVELGVRLDGGYTAPYLRPAALDAWQAERGVVDAVARYGNRSVVLEQGEPRDLRAVTVSREFFPLLGVPPRLGRTFAAEEVAREERVAVVSDALWRSALGADPAAVGSAITLDGARYVVIGVMPATFRYPRGEVGLWLPLGRPAAAAPGRPPERLQAIARLPRGVPLGAAQARADARARHLAAARPDVDGWALQLSPVGAWRANPDMRRALTVLAGAVACVLLIACANAANLLLVRATAARRDLTVRAALGATRGRLVRELLAEAGLLALAGGGLGLGLAYGSVRGMVALAPSELVTLSYGPLAMDGRVLAFAVALSAGTVLLCGVVPALRATRRGTALASGDRAATGTREHRRLRGALVVGQLALSVALLVGAGLLLHSFARLARVAPGMDVHRLALLELFPSAQRYPTRAEREPFYAAVVERVRALPGVDAVSVVSGVAGSSGGFHFGTALEAEGAGHPAGGDPDILPFAEADTSYFRTLGIPIRQGRAFEAADLVPDAHTAIVDGDLARHLWPDGRAVGRRFRTGPDSPWLTVVGIAGDVKLQGPDDRTHRFELYYPSRVGAGGQRTIAVRTAGDPAALLPLLPAAVHAVDPRQPVLDVTTATRQYREPLAKPRFLLLLMAAFAGVAAALAAVGLYGVVSYTVTQRTRELGVRMALGARRARIVGDVVRDGARLAALGMAVGLGTALLLGRFVESLLFGVTPTDPLTLGAVVVGLGAVAVLAAYVPARRASRIDPVVAIRTE